MTAKVRTHSLSVSIDGYGAGEHQSVEDPLGAGGMSLHDWLFETRTFRASHGMHGGASGIDDDLVARGRAGIGATVMGRNMFGPVRDDWGDANWQGWWGDDPPFHHDVFVLTHHPRDPLRLADTTFYFVTDGLVVAVERARDAAGGLDVAVGGGPSTVRACLLEGLLDELHVVIVPVALGAGVRLFDGVGDAMAGYRCVRLASSDAAVHVFFERAAAS